jgi:hypothetical protein
VKAVLWAVVLTSAFIVVGCMGKAEKSERVAEDFKVETLFHHEGCTAFRFFDGGRAVYYIRCHSGRVSSQWVQPLMCGKTPCPRRYTVFTEELP